MSSTLCAECIYFISYTYFQCWWDLSHPKVCMTCSLVCARCCAASFHLLLLLFRFISPRTKMHSPMHLAGENIPNCWFGFLLSLLSLSLASCAFIIIIIISIGCCRCCCCCCCYSRLRPRCCHVFVPCRLSRVISFSSFTLSLSLVFKSPFI